MSGEQESIAQVEPGAPAIEQEIDQEQPVSLDQPQEDPANAGDETDGATAGEDASDELEEFEWNGQKIKGPKGLKDGVLMQADYTRKTQEIAATRRELEDRAQHIEQQSRASDEEMQARATLLGIEGELQKYTQVNWDQWEAEDPFAAQQGWRKFQQLQGYRGQIAAELNDRATARTQEAQQDFAKRVEETRSFAQQNIKGWSPEVDQKLLEYAQSEGLAEGQIRALMGPLFYGILHKAWIGQQALSKPAAAAKPAPQPTPAPLTVVGAKHSAPVRKSLGDMSMDEYVAARKAGRG